MFHAAANSDGLNLWLTFSQKCKEKYDKNGCIRQWKTFTKGTYGIQTLRHFAKRDNLQKYVELTAKRSAKILESSVSLKTSHYRIAKIIYEMYSDIYVCADVDPDVWYKFENHHWTVMAGALDLGTRITNDISRLISTQLAKLYTDKANNPADGDMSEIIDAKIKFLSNLQSKIEDYNFKKNVIKEARGLFYQENFVDKLGRNKYLIGFKNGVYDLKEFILRDGRPDDYISLQMPIAYRVVSDDDPDMLQLKDFFMKVYPDSSIKEYFLDSICEFFIGGNARKLIAIWSGLGNNAKIDFDWKMLL
jgi:phage/plasmid-associated DNA primase